MIPFLLTPPFLLFLAEGFCYCCITPGLLPGWAGSKGQLTFKLTQASVSIQASNLYVMIHLPIWVNFLQQTILFKARYFSCLTRCFRGLMGMVLLLLTAFLPLYAQPAIQWDNTLGGSSAEDFRSLQQTSDGGYILGGSSNSPISGDKTQDNWSGAADFWVVKLDAAGNKQWDKTFGGSDVEYLHSLQQTSDGGYILGGISWSPISGDKTAARRGVIDLILFHIFSGKRVGILGRKH
jgi:hypothetical protein